MGAGRVFMVSWIVTRVSGLISYKCELQIGNRLVSWAGYSRYRLVS